MSIVVVVLLVALVGAAGAIFGLYRSRRQAVAAARRTAADREDRVARAETDLAAAVQGDIDRDSEGRLRARLSLPTPVS